MSWKLSRVINNESKRKWKIFYSTGSSDAPALIPPGVGSLTIRRSIGATYQVSASGTCNWADFESLKLTVKDGDHEMVSSIVPLSQCSNFWTLDLNIVVLLDVRYIQLCEDQWDGVRRVHTRWYLPKQ
jgi:hypothetical protein